MKPDRLSIRDDHPSNHGTSKKGSDESSSVPVSSGGPLYLAPLKTNYP